MGAANSSDDEIRDAMADDTAGSSGQTGGDLSDEVVDGFGEGDDDQEFIFDVDGDTTGADPDSPDGAVNVRPHEKGHLT